MKKFTPIIYQKDNSFDPFYNQKNRQFWFYTKILPPLLTLVGGIVLITQVITPMYVFKTYNTTDKSISNSVLGWSVGFSDFEFKELRASSELVPPTSSDIPKYYYISIPKLGIKDALVETSPVSLSPDNALGHYIGSVMPGEVGNTFIYGHSVLPFFYNPKNYKTIFSTLNTLKIGDVFYINYRNKEYKYVVENIVSVESNKVNPLGYYKPAYLNESTITLMTCDPPGTKLKRLLINAVMLKD